MFASVSSIESGTTVSSCNNINTPNIECVTSTLVGKFETITPHFVPDDFALIFGNHAIQDLDTITISKADLVGLTPSVNNTAESLLVAIITRSLVNARDINLLKVGINYWGHGYTEAKRVDTILVNLFNLALFDGNILLESNYSRTIAPNDY